MPLFGTYKEGDLSVAIWRVDETIPLLRSLWQEDVSYEAACEVLPSEKRRIEWLAVHVLLKVLWGGKALHVSHAPSGKPFLSDCDYRISISHTQGYVAVALHPQLEVGIDIERYGDKVKRVSSRFIRADEEATLRCTDEVQALLLHWSAKETVYKMLGAEKVDFLCHLRVLPFTPAMEGTFQVQEYRTAVQRIYTLRYVTHPDFVLTYSVSL